MGKKAGFSLIELVIVIIVVSLLAIVALPKFLKISDEAKKASIEKVAGGFAAAVVATRVQWEADARPVVDGRNVVNFDGVELFLTDSSDGFLRQGYPVAVVSSGNQSVRGATDRTCVGLMENLLQTPPVVTVESNVYDTSVKYAAVAADNNVCRYTQLTGSTAHNFEYNIATGNVSVNLEDQ